MDKMFIWEEKIPGGQKAQNIKVKQYGTIPWDGGGLSVTVKQRSWQEVEQQFSTCG